MFLVVALGKAPCIIWVVLSCVSDYSFKPNKHPMVYTVRAKEERKKNWNSNSWQGMRNHS